MKPPICPNREHGPWCNREYRCAGAPLEEKPPVQPHSPGAFCEQCGHFAGRHGPDGCGGFPDMPCTCPGMLWVGVRWPRPWLAAPDGLRAS